MTLLLVYCVIRNIRIHPHPFQLCLLFLLKLNLDFLASSFSSLLLLLLLLLPVKPLLLPSLMFATFSSLFCIVLNKNGIAHTTKPTETPRNTFRWSAGFCSIWFCWALSCRPPKDEDIDLLEEERSVCEYMFGFLRFMIVFIDRIVVIIIVVARFRWDILRVKCLHFLRKEWRFLRLRVRVLRARRERAFSRTTRERGKDGNIVRSFMHFRQRRSVLSSRKRIFPRRFHRHHVTA